MSQEEQHNEIAFPSRLVSHPANPPSVDSLPSDPLYAVAGPLDGFFPPTVFRSENETLCERAHPLGGGIVRNMAASADRRVYIAYSGADKVGVVEPVR
jgi:hypothetical protein